MITNIHDSPDALVRLRRVREVFEAAGAAEEPARSALLDWECGSDTALRSEVETLLNADGAPHPILDCPLVVPAHLSGALMPGECVGPYRIVRELGAGGMGSVYLAERSDGTPGEQFALKLVRWPNPEMARRLEEESRILSRLEHPNIARLLDTGFTASGLPFLVTEFVDGQPIDRYCSQKRLPARERARIFRQVCAAVRYLHQNLVVHRDLKPAHVLVTAAGVVKVIDFGIAKLVEPSSDVATRGTLAPMTPVYASPEQIRGEALSTLTDVYTMGAVLYEVLAEVRPFAGGALEVLRKVSENDAPKPSAANPTGGITADLDTVVAKAMQRDLVRRYSSVEQLDEDLRRYLAGLPILARADSVWYRTRKFVLRRKMLVAAIAAILAVLLGGIAATLREARVAEQERARAEEHARDAERERGRARQSEAEAQIQRAEADRRLGELQRLAQGAVRAYQAASEPANHQTALLAETTRDSLLALSREGMLEPSMAAVLDGTLAELRSQDLAIPATWQLPNGWQGAAAHPSEYRIGIDRQFRYQGEPTIFLRSLVANPSGAASVYQEFSAVRYRGKRVQLSAVLRTERAEHGVILGLSTTVGNGEEWRRVPLAGSVPWTPRHVVVDVPADADLIGIALSLTGTGTAWAADFDFREVSRSVPLTGAAPRNLDFTAQH